MLKLAVTCLSGSTSAFRMVRIRLENIVKTLAPDCWQRNERVRAMQVDLTYLGPQIFLKYDSFLPFAYLRWHWSFNTSRIYRLSSLSW